LAGWWLDGALAAAAGAWLGCMVWVVQQLWRAHRLETWFRAGPVGEPPRLAGLWREVSDRIRRVLRLREREVQVQVDRLQHYLEAIQASPNGVTLLDREGRIEWCNSAASQHLGLDAQRDLGQHVVHLVRDPVFSRYFHQSSHEGEVQMDGHSPSISQMRKLSVQLYPYGDGQQLLLTRDITALTQADNMRRDFVANVSHEIRTPLTVLAGFAGVIMILRPTIEQNQLFAGVVGLLSGLIAAMAYMQVAALGRIGEPESRTVFFFSVGTTLVGLLGSLWIGLSAWTWPAVLWLLPVGLLAPADNCA